MGKGGMSQVLLWGLREGDCGCLPRAEGGNSEERGRLQTYDPVLEGDELLLLLLPALKVGFDEGLQFIQVLLHALAVDVLRWTEMGATAVLTQCNPPGARGAPMGLGWVCYSHQNPGARHRGFWEAPGLA